jgi:O-antigen ligase
MRLPHPCRPVALAVFLTALGTVSICSVGPIHFRPYQAALLAAVFLFTGQLLLRGGGLLVPAPLKALSVFFVAIILSLPGSQYPAVTVKQTLLLGVYATMFVMIVNTCRTDSRLISLHRAVILSCLLACAYGLARFVTSNLPGVEKEGLYWYTRPRSFFVEPNEFGLYLVFAFGYVFSELLSGRRTASRALVWITFALAVALIVPNMSRGSWLGCAAAAAAVLYYQHRARLKKLAAPRALKIAAGVSILAALALLAASRFVTTRGKTTVAAVVASRIASTATGGDESLAARLRYTTDAFGTMMEHPLAGVGFGNTFAVLEGGIRSDRTGMFGIPEIGTATSSNFLADIGAETGIPGLLAFAFFLLVLLRQGSRTVRTESGRAAPVRIGAFASAVGLLFNGLTYPIVLMPFFWISAAVLCTPRSAGRQASP